MTYLNLSRSNFSGLVPMEISYLSKLITLDLSWNSFQKITILSIKMLAQNLTKLRQLSLDFVNMSLVSPNSFLNLSSSLMHLSAFDCSINGVFPNHIFKLPNLIYLHLSWNYDISGTLPKSNLSGTLVLLSLSKTSLSEKYPIQLVA